MRPKTRERRRSSTFIILSKFSTDSELLEFLSKPSPYKTVIHLTRMSMNTMAKAADEIEGALHKDSDKDVVMMKRDEHAHLQAFGKWNPQHNHNALSHVREVTCSEVDEFLTNHGAFEWTSDGWLYISSRGSRANACPYSHKYPAQEPEN